MDVVNWKEHSLAAVDVDGSDTANTRQRAAQKLARLGSVAAILDIILDVEAHRGSETDNGLLRSNGAVPCLAPCW